MLTYQVFKMLHILGVVLFLGNIITAAFWKTFADQTRQPEVVAFSQRLIAATDVVFTLGGVVLILIGGFGMSLASTSLARPSCSTAWRCLEFRD